MVLVCVCTLRDLVYRGLYSQYCRACAVLGHANVCMSFSHVLVRDHNVSEEGSDYLDHVCTLIKAHFAFTSTSFTTRIFTIFSDFDSWISCTWDVAFAFATLASHSKTVQLTRNQKVWSTLTTRETGTPKADMEGHTRNQRTASRRNFPDPQQPFRAPRVVSAWGYVVMRMWQNRVWRPHVHFMLQYRAYRAVQRYQQSHNETNEFNPTHSGMLAWVAKPTTNTKHYFVHVWSLFAS